jgi:hypothetical protein
MKVRVEFGGRNFTVESDYDMIEDRTDEGEYVIITDEVTHKTRKSFYESLEDDLTPVVITDELTQTSIQSAILPDIDFLPETGIDNPGYGFCEDLNELYRTVTGSYTHDAHEDFRVIEIKEES